MSKVQGDWIAQPAVQAVCSVLQTAGYQVYFVGGCVRNSLLKMPVSDLDLTTDAPPDIVLALYEQVGMKTIPTGIEHGTVTVVQDGIPFEITTFRQDVETDGRHAKIAFSTSINDDARRRDFTMNALYACATGEILDPLGGLGDLWSRRVRFIDDPDARIKEDYLRILRFFRFFAWYGDPDQGIDADGLAGCAANIDGLSGLSQERITAEILKLLAAPNPCQSCAAMAKSSVLGTVLPQSDPKALFVLTLAEDSFGIVPDAIRRLAALGVNTETSALRLSKSDRRRLNLYYTEIQPTLSAMALGYYHGQSAATDIVLLRSAYFETPVDASDITALIRGAEAKLPVSAADLMPEYQGKALGAALARCEELWIESDLTLSREALLGRL